MISQNEIKKRSDFWKKWFLEQTRDDLNMTLGLVKSMTYNAYANNGDCDDTGLYQASLLAENRLENFTKNILEDKIGTIIDLIFMDISSLTTNQDNPPDLTPDNPS
jgi:hypothetical protein